MKNISIRTRTNFPPKRFLPNISNVVVKHIQMCPGFSNKYLFYYASESNEMLLKDRKNLENLSEIEAYDDFENSGIARFNNDGYVEITVVKPTKYIGKTKRKFTPHLHFKVSHDGKTWSDEEYTIDL